MTHYFQDPFPPYFFDPDILPSTLFSNTLNPCHSLRVRPQQVKLKLLLWNYILSNCKLNKCRPSSSYQSIFYMHDKIYILTWLWQFERCGTKEQTFVFWWYWWTFILSYIRFYIFIWFFTGSKENSRECNCKHEEEVRGGASVLYNGTSWRDPSFDNSQVEVFFQSLSVP